MEEKALARQLQNTDETSLESGSFRVSGARWRGNLGTTVRVILGFFLCLLIWQAAAMYMNLSGNTLHFPLPVETLERLGEYFFDGKTMYGKTIFAHILASVRRLVIAFGLASLVGITLGSVLGFFNKIYQVGIVPVALFQMIPGLAWLPVALLLFGLGDDTAIFIIFAVSSMVVTIGVASGIRMVPEVLVHAARMTGAKGPAIFFKVLLPQASVSIINALRLGMSSAWRVLIAAEMVVGTGVGIGYSIQLSRDLMDYLGSFACIAVICFIGLFIDRIILASFERLMRSRIGMEA